MTRNTHRSNRRHNTHTQQTASKEDLIILAILAFMLLWTIGQNIENHYREIRTQEHYQQILDELPEGAIIANGQVITREQQEQAAREYEIREQQRLQEEANND